MGNLKDLFSRTNRGCNMFINACGNEQVKLGSEKIYILDLIESMLSVKNKRLTKTIADSGILNQATTHFCQYPENNIYGNLYLKIAKGIVNSANDNLVQKFLGEDGSLINQLVEITKDTKLRTSKGSFIRKPHLGQVISILRELKATKRETAIELRDKHPLWEDCDKNWLTEEMEIQDKEFYKDPVTDSLVVPGNLDMGDSGVIS